MKIGIIDIGISNIKSVINAFNKIEISVFNCNEIKNFKESNAFVLPGVGSFNIGMENIKKNNFYNQLRYEILENKKPILGICLGMQLLCSKGFENNVETLGLEFIQGDVKKINIPKTINNNFKLPHVGWNDVKISNDKGIFKNIKQHSNFYFIHSYFADIKDKSKISSTTYNGSEFTSSFEFENISGVQFHPEKSQKLGLKILKNWYDYIK